MRSSAGGALRRNVGGGRATFLVIAGLAVLQVGASTVLYLRTRPLYRAEFAALKRSAAR